MWRKNLLFVLGGEIDPTLFKDNAQSNKAFLRIIYIYIPLASFERPLIPWILDMASLAMRSKVVPKPLWPPESESGPSLLDIIDSFGSFSITFA